MPFRLSEIVHTLNSCSLLIALFSVVSIGSCDKLPEAVSISVIPDYYFDNHYLDNRVKAIQDAIAECDSGCETFFWITDMHWEPELNTRLSPPLIKYISSKTGINRVLNGGDLGNSHVIRENAIAQLKSAIGSNNVYTVTGNHEMYDVSRYERPYLRVAEELRGHNADIVYGGDNESFFYFDNASNKTRYIGLASYGCYRDEEYESCYTFEQLAWLNNVALNVENGWTVVIFSHSLYYVHYVSDKLVINLLGASSFIDAIDNYKGKGIVACVLMGHAHRDRLHIGSTGVPYIISASDQHETYHGDINVERIPGTISEQHFEVVVVNKGKRTVKLFSVGSNARDGYDDEAGKEVDVRIVNY